jgi:hypothetical protein
MLDSLKTRRLHKQMLLGDHGGVDDTLHIGPAAFNFDRGTNMKQD